VEGDHVLQSTFSVQQQQQLPMSSVRLYESCSSILHAVHCGQPLVLVLVFIRWCSSAYHMWVSMFVGLATSPHFVTHQQF
jgi:hypothetical protein